MFGRHEKHFTHPNDVQPVPTTIIQKSYKLQLYHYIVFTSQCVHTPLYKHEATVVGYGGFTGFFNSILLIRSAHRLFSSAVKHSRSRKVSQV